MVRNLIEPRDFTTEELSRLFDLADDIISNPRKYMDVCKGYVLASLFLSLQQEPGFHLKQQ